MDNDPRQNIPGKKGDCHNGTWVGICTVVKGLSAMQETQETQVRPWVRKIPWRKVWQSTPVFLPAKSHG